MPGGSCSPFVATGQLIEGCVRRSAEIACVCAPAMIGPLPARPYCRREKKVALKEESRYEAIHIRGTLVSYPLPYVGSFRKIRQPCNHASERFNSIRRAQLFIIHLGVFAFSRPQRFRPRLGYAHPVSDPDVTPCFGPKCIGRQGLSHRTPCRSSCQHMVTGSMHTVR